MKKGILVVLVILLVFSLWSVFAFGKAKNEGNVQQPTQIQKAEPGPEAFPAVVLPKVKPTKPTTEDFQKLMLEKKGLTREMLEQRKLENVPAEGLDAAEKELFPTLCTIGNQVLPCCYRNSTDNLYLRCYGAVGTAVFLDPENNGYGMAVCPYPIYPFEARKVAMALNTTDTCTVVFRPEIWSVVYIDGLPYPGAPIAVGTDTTMTLIGGTVTTYLNIGPVCLYEPWFAVMVYVNTDDRLDPDYCPTGNAIPDYQSWIFDISGRVGQSYWGPYYEYGLPYGWFDVVPNAICSGVIRVRTQGYTRPENTCVIPPDYWYYKDGMPDFYQYQGVFPNNGAAYCGPVAGSNSIWWFGCIANQFAPWWGGCDPGMEIALINEVAAAAGTDPILGTNCDALEAALIDVIKAHGGWWFTETTVYAPDFWYLQKQLRASQDVVLLLGFWQTPDGGTTWTRFGGHFVTLAGVDWMNYAFAFSDPATTPEGYDKYPVAWPSASPGGVVWIPDYYLPWIDFQGQNAGPLPNNGTYNPALPVQVEVEQAIVVCPGLREMSGEVDGSSSAEINNNHGGIEAFYVDFGAGFQNGLYYGTFIAGTSQADLSCDYGDYRPLMTFDPLGPPVLDSFVVAGSAGDYVIWQLTNQFAHRYIDGLTLTEYAFGVWVPVGGTEDCEYAIEDVLVLQNTSAVPIVGLQTGMWCDFDISSGGTNDLAGYDQQHNSVWMYDNATPTAVFGFTKKPQIVGDVPITGYSFSQSARVYDGQYVDSLKYWMDNLGWGIDEPTTAEDKSIIIADGSFDLPAGAIRVEKWLKWGSASGGDLAWKCFLYKVLHQEGFYRGDVNKDTRCDAKDVAYLNAYVNAGGPSPVEFADQGDVNGDGDVNQADVTYLTAYVNTGGPAPIDYNRWLDESPFVDPAYKAFGIRNPGLFGDPDWARLVDKCGDANGDDKVLVDDVIYLINYLYKGGPLPVKNSDVNCDGKVSVADVIYLINFLFKGGPIPCVDCPC
jgi:hypothetical protein